MKTRKQEKVERKKKKKNCRNRLRNDEYLQRQRKKLNARDRKAELIQYRRQDLIGRYEAAIRDGPTIVCNCCGGLFFKQSIFKFEKEISPDLLAIIRQMPTGPETRLCFTCRKSAIDGKVPKLCLANGLAFPELPDVLVGLTELEKRLSSPRVPFMQIKERGVDKQFGIRGSVVNVPIDVQKSIDVLPRAFNNTETVQLLLKRMRQHKTNFINEFIRP